jgi:glucan biosynthesis protein C
VVDRAARSAAPGSPPRFLGPRSRRLLLPLVFGMVLVVPPQSYYEVVQQLPGGYHDGYLAFWARYLRADTSFCDGDGCLILPTWNHLWFVAYLWVYSAVLWILWRLARRWLLRLRELLGGVLRGWAALLLPALSLGLARLALAEHFPATHALVDDLFNHVQYLGVFVLGWAVARRHSFWDSLQDLRWIALALWLASWLVLTQCFTAEAWSGFGPVQRGLARLCWGLDQWSAIVAVLGFARRLAPGDSPLLRYLGAAVFPVYILHQTLIVVLSQWLRPLDLAPVVEGPLLVLATLALSFGAYALIRITPPLRPLFGLAPAAAPESRRG